MSAIEKITITVADMMEAILVCNELAEEHEPKLLAPDIARVQPLTERDERIARSLRLAALMMARSKIGTIERPEAEVSRG